MYKLDGHSYIFLYNMNLYIKLMRNRHINTFDFLMAFVSGTIVGAVGYRFYE